MMSKLGVFMLEKLVFQYSQSAGSSVGMRGFLSELLPSIKASNPQIEIVEQAHSRQHPKTIAYYRNGTVKPIDVKNLSPKQILDHVLWLRSSHGRDQDDKVTSGRHISRNPSIQGQWTATTFASQPQPTAIKSNQDTRQ